MAKRERLQNLVVRMAPDELAKLHALALAADSSIADLVRTFVSSAYFAKWGNAEPPTPKLKFKPRTA